MQWPVLWARSDDDKRNLRRPNVGDDRQGLLMKDDGEGTTRSNIQLPLSASSGLGACGSNDDGAFPRVLTSCSSNSGSMGASTLDGIALLTRQSLPNTDTEVVSFQVEMDPTPCPLVESCCIPPAVESSVGGVASKGVTTGGAYLAPSWGPRHHCRFLLNKIRTIRCCPWTDEYPVPSAVPLAT